MNHLNKCAPVVENLIAAMVDNPRAADVKCRPLPPGLVNWYICVDVNDVGKIVGMKGVHLRGLQLLVERMGRIVDEVWSAKIVDPVGTERSERRIADKPATHNTGTDVLLLGDILSAMQVSASIHVTGNIDRGFTMLLVPTSQQALAELEETHEALYSRNQREREPLTVVKALNDVFRAVAGRQGVNYKITIPQ